MAKMPTEIEMRVVCTHDAHDFGWAIARLRAGDRICRSGWNGKGMWLILVGVEDWAVSEAFVGGEPHEALPWIGMKTADEKFVPWLASQTDMLAEDWELAT